MATRKRRLGDLFVKGAELKIGDELGSITVWVQKLNPVEHEKAFRRANAARARYMTFRQHRESDDFLAILNEVMDMEEEDLIEFCVTDEMAKRIGAIESRVAEENGWNKEDYLQGLLDAWNGDEEAGVKALSDVFDAGSPEDDDEDYKEAKRVYDELERFSNEVEHENEKERNDLRASFASKELSQLQDVLIDKMFKLQADLAWTIEYQKSRIWLGVREPDNHKKLYFLSRDEVDELDQEVLSMLIEGYTNMETSGEEGKDSPPSQDSSEQSDSPEPQETGVS